MRLQIAASVYDPHDPMGRMFFNVLATFAEFEADLLSLRTREGMAVARAKGRLKGKPPKLSASQQTHLLKQLHAGEHTIPELAELFSVSRATVYRVIERAEVELRPASGAPTISRGADGIAGAVTGPSVATGLRSSARRW